MKPLNPHDVFWLSATPAEVDVWFKQLKEHGESVVPFGDLGDIRPYLVHLIKPLMVNGDKTFIEEIVKQATKQPARLFIVGGRIVGFVIAEEVIAE